MCLSPCIAVRTYRVSLRAPCTIDFVILLLLLLLRSIRLVLLVLLCCCHTFSVFCCFHHNSCCPPPHQPPVRIYAGGVRATLGAVSPPSGKWPTVVPQPTGGPHGSPSTAPPAATTGCASRSSDKLWASVAPSGQSRSREPSRRRRRGRKPAPTDSSATRSSTSRRTAGRGQGLGKRGRGVCWVMTMLLRTWAMTTVTALGDFFHLFIRILHISYHTYRGLLFRVTLVRFFFCSISWRRVTVAPRGSELY